MNELNNRPIWIDPTLDELYHWGVKGMKWGVRRYQNKDGSLTEAGKKRYYNEDGSFTKEGKKRNLEEVRKLHENEIINPSRSKEKYNKDPNRFKNSEMIVSAINKDKVSDLHRRRAELIRKRNEIDEELYQENKKAYSKFYEDHGRDPTDQERKVLSDAAHLRFEKRRNEIDLLFKEQEKLTRQCSDAGREVANEFLGKYGKVSVQRSKYNSAHSEKALDLLSGDIFRESTIYWTKKVKAYDMFEWWEYRD